MTYQEILDGIIRHRSNMIHKDGTAQDLIRKLNEIEWALQALAERLRDDNPEES